MELYLIRHAQSENNARPEEERVEDPGLTEVGHQQAQRLARWIPQLELTRLITSPFLRALLTTEAIRQQTCLRPQVRVRLHELGGCMQGPYPAVMQGRPGLGARQIQRKFPDYCVKDVHADGWWQSRPFETIVQAQSRARTLLLETMEEFGGTGDRVAYVMHADFKRIFLEQFHDDELEMPYNSSVSQLTLSDRQVRLTTYNQTSHLPTDLLTI